MAALAALAADASGPAAVEGACVPPSVALPFGGFERALGKRLQEMRDDLTALVRTINATRNELAEARQAVGTTERALESARGAERRSRLAEKIRDGRAAARELGLDDVGAAALAEEDHGVWLLFGLPSMASGNARRQPRFRARRNHCKLKDNISLHARDFP